jgi:hypothetical protein
MDENVLKINTSSWSYLPYSYLKELPFPSLLTTHFQTHLTSDLKMVTHCFSTMLVYSKNITMCNHHNEILKFYK